MKPAQLNNQQMNEAAIKYAYNVVNKVQETSLLEFLNTYFNTELWYWNVSQHNTMLNLSADIVAVFYRKPSDLKLFWSLNK